MVYPTSFSVCFLYQKGVRAGGSGGGGRRVLGNIETWRHLESSAILLSFALLAGFRSPEKDSSGDGKAEAAAEPVRGGQERPKCLLQEPDRDAGRDQGNETALQDHESPDRATEGRNNRHGPLSRERQSDSSARLCA